MVTNTENEQQIAPSPAFVARHFQDHHSFQLDVLKVFALVLMVVDHINTAFNINSPWLYLAGRVVFPIFAVVFAANMGEDPQKWERAAKRGFVAALLCQPFYWLAFSEASFKPCIGFNILLLFASVAQALVWWHKGTAKYKTLATFLCLGTAAITYPSSYGPTGVLLVLVTCLCFLAKTELTRKKCSVAWWIVIAILNYKANPVLIVSICYMVFMVLELSKYLKTSQLATKRIFPRNAFYWLYGSHLAIIGGLVIVL